MTRKQESLHSNIWSEDSDPNNPFNSNECYLHGVSIFSRSGLLQEAGLLETYFFAFSGRKPLPWEHELLEKLSIASLLMGPRSPTGRAAIAAGAGQSTVASISMAALAVGAGQMGGGYELLRLIKLWEKCGCDLDVWVTSLQAVQTSKHNDGYSDTENMSVWPESNDLPGFDLHSPTCSQPVLSTLDTLAGISQSASLPWLQANRVALEEALSKPISLVAVAAAAFHDLEFEAQVSEAFWLMMLTISATLHGLEQTKHGTSKYPLFPDGLKIKKIEDSK